jgi:acetyltransferase-like isoleucine patch superfamily enzyme
MMGEMQLVPLTDLSARGLLAGDGRMIHGELNYERPAYIYRHRLKNCTVGAFTYFNAAGSTSAYRVTFGRYSQIGESSILGPPEHPMDWFSSHPFTFTRPQHMPNIYSMPDFARLGPDASDQSTWADAQPNDTYIGHEAYVGAGSFVKRGVSIGHGACIGARSVVTRDIPPYAIAVGSPARVIRLRFDERIVERLLKLQWWRYDLAPFKHQVDYSQVEATLAFFEQRHADNDLAELTPDTYRVSPAGEALRFERLPQPLFCTDADPFPPTPQT